MELTLKLTVEEINAVLQTLGNLPTSSGAWPLVVKIKAQAEAQVAPAAAPQADPDVVSPPLPWSG
jgi:hypothetical protein